MLLPAAKAIPEGANQLNRHPQPLWQLVLQRMTQEERGSSCHTKHIYKPIVGKTVTIHSKPRVDDVKVRWPGGLSQGSLSDAVPSGGWGWSQSGQTHHTQWGWTGGSHVRCDQAWWLGLAEEAPHWLNERPGRQSTDSGHFSCFSSS